MLDGGQCNGSYADACVLLSSLLSGIAAELWPGTDRIDARRFVELWTRFCLSELQAIQISVPLLRRSFLESGRDRDAKVLEERRPDMFTLGHGSLVLRGAEVDLSEAEVLKLPIELPGRKSAGTRIRRSSTSMSDQTLSTNTSFRKMRRVTEPRGCRLVLAM